MGGILVSGSRTDRNSGLGYKAELYDLVNIETAPPVLHSNAWFTVFRLFNSNEHKKHLSWTMKIKSEPGGDISDS